MSTQPVRSTLLVACLVLAAIALTACGRHADKEVAGDLAPILLFNGKGTSPTDVAAVETVLREQPARLLHREFFTLEPDDGIAAPANIVS